MVFTLLDCWGKFCHLTSVRVAFSALMTLLVGRQEGHGGWWWALVSPDGVAPSRMVGVSASVNLPLKSRSSLLALADLGGPGKRAVIWLW